MVLPTDNVKCLLHYSAVKDWFERGAFGPTRGLSRPDAYCEPWPPEFNARGPCGGKSADCPGCSLTSMHTVASTHLLSANKHTVRSGKGSFHFWPLLGLFSSHSSRQIEVPHFRVSELWLWCYNYAKPNSILPVRLNCSGILQTSEEYRLGNKSELKVDAESTIDVLIAVISQIQTETKNF